MKITLDNTSATAIERCPEYYHLRHEQGIVPIAIATPLSFGGAMHQGWKKYYDTNRNVVDACAEFSVAWEPFEGLDKKRTEEKGHELLLAYDEQFKDEPWLDKQGEIEFNLPFAVVCSQCGGRFLPQFNLPNCERCGGEILDIWYSGIIDRIGLFHGDWVIHEFKTSSSPRDFVVRPNNQVTGYVWGAKSLLGEPFKNSLVTIAGIFLSSERGYYTSKAGGSSARVSVLSRHYTPRTDEELLDFNSHIIDCAMRIFKYKSTGIWPKWTESCGYKYGLCPYQPLCSAPKTQEQFLLETAYRVEPWVPGKRPVGKE